jgi:Tfp pilus assembly protein PilN
MPERDRVKRFNFLHFGAHEALERLRAVEVSPPLRRSTACLCLSIALVSAATAVERVRCDAAERDASLAQARLVAAERDVRSLRNTLAMVTRLGSIARQVREMRSSGRSFAARFAEIGVQLPSGAWLESLHDDDGVVLLGGQADGYATVARAIRAIAQVRGVAQLELVAAHAVDAPGVAAVVAYRVRLIERAR